MGLERTMAAMEKEGLQPPAAPPIDVYLVGAGEEAERVMTRLMHGLRVRGYRAERDYMGRGLKNQLKSAERAHPSYTVLLGDEEARISQVTVTDHLRSTQESSSVTRLLELLDGKLRRDMRDRARAPREEGRSRRREEPVAPPPEREVRRHAEEPPREERARSVEPANRIEERPPTRRRDEWRRREEDAEGRRRRDDDAGTRFDEWAATYRDAARASASQRTQRHYPLAETALTHTGDAGAARRAWSGAQAGLATRLGTPPHDNIRWPAEPFPLAQAIPTRNLPPALSSGDIATNWLVDEPAEPGAVVKPFGATDEASDEEHDPDAEIVAADAAGENEGGEAERRRRSGRRGGRRHSRRRQRKA